MKNLKKGVGFCLVIGLLMCLVGSFGQMITQTNFGKTRVEKIVHITESGYKQAAVVYIPDNATPETKAPVIVALHGGNDDKYLMIRYLIEMAKRGYVAVSLDMYSHGESERLPDSEWLTAGRGMYDMVREVVTWPFVDTDRVSLMGYSRGGRAAGEALELDNQTLNVIKNIYVLFSDPIYANADGFTDVYGPRNITVLADLYDEFFFTEKADNTGTYSNDANRFMQTLTSPVDYIHNPSAQSFLYFGEDPAGKEERLGETIYSKEYENGTGTREIRSINQSHMAGHYSLAVMQDAMDFFERVESAPNSSNNVALVAAYDVFALIGMIGLLVTLIFAVAFIVKRIPFFAELADPTPTIRTITDKKDKIWHWGAVVVGILLNIFILWLVNILKFSSWHDSIFKATAFVYVPIMCLLFSIFLLIVSSISAIRDKKNNQWNAVGFSRVLIGWRKVGKAALLAVIGLIMFYIISFAAEYFFGTVFKFTMWNFQTFSADRLGFAILVMPMLTLFYIVMAINNDGMGYSSIYTTNKILNAILTAFVNTLPLIVVLVYFYGTFRLTGWNPMFAGNAAAGNSIYKLPVIIFTLVLVSRIIFEKTGNIYIGGFASGILASTITANICEIRLPEVDEAFVLNGQFIGLIIVAYAIFIGCMIYFKKNHKA